MVMQARLLGVQRIQFTNSNGENIAGMNIYCAYADENVQGEKASKFFLKEGIALPKDTQLNDTIELSFNMRGKVELISKVK